ncbi:hypothetical protein BGZ51_001490, partial [Haplosporangium sp. Z 767]
RQLHGSAIEHPNVTYMGYVHGLFLEESAVPSLRNDERTQKRRYADAMGTAKGLASKAAGSIVIHNKLMRSLSAINIGEHESDSNQGKLSGEIKDLRVKKSEGATEIPSHQEQRRGESFEQMRSLQTP